MANRNDLRIGDRVSFGRRNGEQTIGRIVKLNARRVKIRQIGIRGTQKVHPEGTVWTVGYDMITKLRQATNKELAAGAREAAANIELRAVYREIVNLETRLATASTRKNELERKAKECASALAATNGEGS